jgi:ubiquinone/menaquinone biosynthesis C-methylase UbiE
VESIRKFPNQEKFKGMIENAVSSVVIYGVSTISSASIVSVVYSRDFEWSPIVI